MRKRITLILIIVVLAIIIGIAYFFLADVLFGENRNPDSGPPDASFEARHQWGKNHLKEWYEKTIEWINISEIIKKDVGTIKSIAPIGKPNYLSCSFTEGCQGNFTLEVIGEKGEGIFSVWGAGIGISSDNFHFSGSRWKFGEKETQIHQSGVPCDEYYKPENIVANYTKEIEASQNLEEKDRIYFVQSLVGRSMAFAELNKLEEAISDTEKVLDYYIASHKNQQVVLHGFSRQKKTVPWESLADSKKERNKIKRFLAFLYYSSSQYGKAENILEEIFGDTNYENLAVDDFKTLTRDYESDSLWLWTMQSKNKNPLANENLKNKINIARAKSQEAKKNNQNYEVDNCFEKSVDYLLGDIDENEFSRKGFCLVYKNYYIGQKKLLGGDKNAALGFFRKFIEDDYWKESEDKCADKYAHSNYYVSFNVQHEIARKFVDSSDK